MKVIFLDIDGVLNSAKHIHELWDKKESGEISVDTYWKINDTANTSGWIGYQIELTFDNTPTQNSDNPVKSGGIYDAIANRVVMTIHR